MRSQSRRLWLVVAMVAAFTAISATSLSGAVAKPGPQIPEVCNGRQLTASQFRPFSLAVWDRDRWQRGKPDHPSIAAQRRALKCAAGPGHQKAMQNRWGSDKGRFYVKRKHCLSGPVFAGKVSTFSGGLTAGGFQATEPGIALRSSATLGETFRLRTSHGTDYVLQTDWGPASWTGRSIDITLAEASRLGGVTTDSWGEAKLIPSNCL